MGTFYINISIDNIIDYILLSNNKCRFLYILQKICFNNDLHLPWDNDTLCQSRVYVSEMSFSVSKQTLIKVIYIVLVMVTLVSLVIWDIQIFSRFSNVTSIFSLLINTHLHAGRFGESWDGISIIYCNTDKGHVYSNSGHFFFAQDIFTIGPFTSCSIKGTKATFMQCSVLEARMWGWAIR